MGKLIIDYFALIYNVVSTFMVQLFEIKVLRKIRDLRRIK
jgi:hypothetical protein